MLKGHVVAKAAAINIASEPLAVSNPKTTEGRKPSIAHPTSIFQLFGSIVNIYMYIYIYVYVFSYAHMYIYICRYMSISPSSSLKLILGRWIQQVGTVATSREPALVKFATRAWKSSQ